MNAVAENTNTLDRARRLIDRALQHQLRGDIRRATLLLERSIELHETAEGWCYLGWCHSARGKLSRAIAHCRRAIALDPEYGNAYNDIGAYLVELGKTEEAARWFTRAKAAPRYATPQFPYLNTARLHIAAARYSEALMELQAARAIAPLDERIDELVEYVGLLMGTHRAA